MNSSQRSVVREFDYERTISHQQWRNLVDSVENKWGSVDMGTFTYNYDWAEQNINRTTPGGLASHRGMQKAQSGAPRIRIVANIPDEKKEEYQTFIENEAKAAHRLLLLSLNGKNGLSYRILYFITGGPDLESLMYSDVVTVHISNTTEESLAFIADNALVFYIGDHGDPFHGNHEWFLRLLDKHSSDPEWRKISETIIGLEQSGHCVLVDCGSGAGVGNVVDDFVPEIIVPRAREFLGLEE